MSVKQISIFIVQSEPFTAPFPIPSKVPGKLGCKKFRVIRFDKIYLYNSLLLK